jgi:hypothetical protein
MSGTDYEVRRHRGSMDAGWLQARFSFSFGGYVHPAGDRFGPLLALNEDVVQPGRGFPMHPHRDLEIFMLPLRGAIAHEDSLGNRLTFGTGQVLMMRAGSGIAHSQFNASETAPDHHLQIWIEPAREGLPPGITLHTLAPGEPGAWQALAGDTQAPLPLAQDAKLRIAIASASTPLALELAETWAGYLHVVQGECVVDFHGGAGESLAAGDALAIRAMDGKAMIRSPQECTLLLVSFPASLLRRKRTNAVVRAGR